jgi:DNA-binding response OmpR family regulator
MHVLVVEDDSVLGDLLGRGLRVDGHEVVLAADGESALEFAERIRPELMILDLGLPRKDGLEVLVEMGQRFSSTSVMVLTGRAELEERVKCLELGADDVVMKPFSFQELRARLKALGRRRRRSEETVLRFGDLEMDRVEHRAWQGGLEMELTAAEFLLLESLLRRRGERVCSRMELLQEVWQARAGAGTNIVEVYINYLRRKLGQTGLHGSKHECLIRTVRGEGYILARSGLEGIAESRAPWNKQQTLSRGGMIPEKGRQDAGTERM